MREPKILDVSKALGVAYAVASGGFVLSEVFFHPTHRTREIRDFEKTCVGNKNIKIRLTNASSTSSTIQRSKTWYEILGIFTKRTYHLREGQKLRISVLREVEKITCNQY